MSGDGSYAPKSPDLSSLFSAPDPVTHPTPPPPFPLAASQAHPHARSHFHPHSHPQAQAQAQASSQALNIGPTQQHFAPLSQPHLQQQQAAFAPPSALLPQHHQPGQHHLQPPQAHYLTSSPGLAPHQPPPQPPQPHHQLSSPYPPYYASPAQGPGHPPPPSYGVPSSQQQAYYPSLPSYAEPQYQFPPQQQGYPQPHPHAPGGPLIKQEVPPHSDLNMPPRRLVAQAAQSSPVIDPSPVRTKFPTARIKRIMQADEEVGKVAQQTPIAVGKALELFMVALVTKSADVAKDKNSKRVTAQMLKHVVESDDQWDFLREIVGKVEIDEKGSKAGRAKAESESDDEEVAAAEVKKKGKGGRKKKGTA